MKHFLFSLLFFGIFSQAQIVDIPDPLFKAKLLEADTTNQIAKDLNGNFFKIDSNNDGEIQVSEAEMVSYLNVTSIDSKTYENYKIESKTGIDSFSKLKEFYALINDRYFYELQNINDVSYDWVFEAKNHQNVSIVVKNCPNLVNISFSRSIYHLGFVTTIESLKIENTLEVINSNNLEELNLTGFFDFNSLKLSNPSKLKKLNLTFSGKNELDLREMVSLEEISSEVPNFLGGSNPMTNYTSKINVAGLSKLKKLKGYLYIIDATGCINLEEMTGSVGGDFSKLGEYNLLKLNKIENTHPQMVGGSSQNPYYADAVGFKDGVVKLYNLPSLKIFQSSNQGILHFDINNSPLIEGIYLNNAYRLTELKIHNQRNLKIIYVSQIVSRNYTNFELQTVDIQHNPKLESVGFQQYGGSAVNPASGILLKSINLSNNPNFNYFYCMPGSYATVLIEKFYGNNLPSLKKLNLLLDDIGATWRRPFLNNNSIVELNGTTGLQELTLGYRYPVNEDSSFTNLDLSALSLLEKLTIEGGNFDILNLEYNAQLNTINTKGSLGINELILGNKEPLDIFINQYTGSDKSQSKPSLDFIKGTGVKNIKKLMMGFNVDNVITSGFDKLESLEVRGVKGIIDAKGSPLLKKIHVKFSEFESLDLSNNPLLTYKEPEDEQYPSISDFPLHIFNSNFKELYVKNGSLNEGFYWFNPTKSALDLNYICTDEFEIDYYQDKFPNAEINSDCTSSPKTSYNTIKGKAMLDLENNTCTSGFQPLTNYGITSIDEDNFIKTDFTNQEAEYTFYTVYSGDFTLQPKTQSSLYTAEPAVVSFADTNYNVKTQDFCLVPNGVKNDVEVRVVPMLGARPGEEANYKVVYKNKGNTTFSGKIDFVYDEPSLDFVSASIEPTKELGHLSWTYDNLKPFDQKEILLTMKLNSPQDTPPLVFNDVLKYGAIISPTENDQTTDDNTFMLKQTVVGSYDPNDKTCLQGDIISHEMVGNYVDYLIRFQNIGTDFARNVVIKDIIDTNLFDIESFQPVSSSHPHRLTITDGNKVEYYFENIKLPGSYDEPNSHGYVSFKIKTKPMVKIGDELKNLANIYFDYNDPIETNEAKSMVANIGIDPVIVPGDNSIDEDKIAFTNPVKDFITFDREVKMVNIYDLQGKLLQTVIVNGKEMSVINLKPGVYVVEIKTNTKVFRNKLLKL